MGTTTPLQDSEWWRVAVWALRAGYAGLLVAISGVFVFTSGSTRSVLTVGIAIWLAAALVTLTSAFRARHLLQGPRPGLWAMRFMLVRDTLRRHQVPRSQHGVPDP